MPLEAHLNPTLMSPISTPSIAEDVQLFNDLRHLSAEEQTKFLLEREAQMRVAGTIDTNVYLLRGKMESVLAHMRNVEEGMFDVDGTLTGIGTRTLEQKNIEGIQRLRETDMTATGITGRHHGQVAELWQNHPEGTGIDTWLIEQGFYKTAPGMAPEYFAGSPALEKYVTDVRTKMAQHLPILEAEHGIQFVTTSAVGYPEAHKSMYSLDAHHPGTDQKITNSAQHDQILGQFREIWRGYDPEGITAKTGTSSIGTFEWTVDGINKEVGILEHLNQTGRNPSRIAIFGDSGNDLAAFQSLNDYLKVVIMNPHTKQPLVQNSHLATVGIGNAAPILRVMHKVRTSI